MFGGKRVPKDDLRIEAYGTVDELNSVLGVVRSLKPHKKIDEIVKLIQNQLFAVGAELATPNGGNDSYIPRIEVSHVTELEKIIDELQEKLKPLKVFILPGGSVVAAHLHLARTVCRRAERAVVCLARNEEIGNSIIVYLNRLSDLLFVLARFANAVDRYEEVAWNNQKRKLKS